ncbi:MAG: TonB-dependent receptor plug domain-containing protein, partial [Gammaproteobacteria bacterium]|nr:TonB-dependent receptor plug domain-containing protein [Gammaproteobacteria bacterium]
MKNSYNKIGVAVKHALILGAGLSLATTPLSAAEDDGAREERVVITGSRIKRVDAEGVSPVVSITREEMDRQGLATVQDVIDGLTQNAGGSIDQSFTFGFTPAASSVNLRGFGFGRTLTLLDGRRMPIYPVGISGTTNFVDLSSIPTAMIERIDILTDGASAIYGSDAVSGVINIITRKDINGSDLTLRRSVTADGGADTSRFQFLSGVTTDKTTVDFIVDYWKQGALYARDRDYAGSDVANARGAYSIGGSSFLGLDTGTIYQDPNCGTPNDALGGLGQPDQVIPIFSANDTWCGFDRTAYRMLFSPSEQKSATGRVTYEINPDLSFFGRVG